MSAHPAWSVVIPTFDEEGRIDATLEAVAQWFDDRGEDYEIIVVDDGSGDETRALVRARAAPRVRLIALGRNRGKGAAVRVGMLAAQGERRLFMDADLATPMDELASLGAALDDGADVAVGSRGLPSSDLEVRQSIGRESLGRSFNALLRALKLTDLSDTQCGFKLLTAQAVEALFPHVRTDGFAFDVELLALAKRKGMCVREVPVRWRHVERSKVSPVRDSIRMLRDALRIRRRLGR